MLKLAFLSVAISLSSQLQPPFTFLQPLLEGTTNQLGQQSALHIKHFFLLNQLFDFFVFFSFALLAFKTTLANSLETLKSQLGTYKVITNDDYPSLDSVRQRTKEKSSRTKRPKRELINIASELVFQFSIATLSLPGIYRVATSQANQVTAGYEALFFPLFLLALKVH